LPTEVRIFISSSRDVNQIVVKKLKTINNSKVEMEFTVEVEVQALVCHKNLMLCLCSYCVGAGL
jgi:TATA-box binding protein (TBP) (component of TFIID and TFIIIB)